MLSQEGSNKITALKYYVQRQCDYMEAQNYIIQDATYMYKLP